MACDYTRIAQDNIRRRGEEFDDIGRLISEELYSDKTHFIYELLQNAEDALARRFISNSADPSPRRLQFKLFIDRLEFRHYGTPFNEEDVKGITDVLKGTKREDIAQIGKFGIGFKSVYSFTSSPEVHSGDEHFVIKRYIRPKKKNPDVVINSGETVFIFPFDHADLTAIEAYALILNKLKQLGPRVMLFLRWIEEIEWSAEPEGINGIYLKEKLSFSNFKNVSRVNVLGQRNEIDENESWLVFDRNVKSHNNNSFDVSIPVEIAFLLVKDDKEKKDKIIRIDESPLVAFFPTEKETRLGFLIQGPYKTTPSRDNILRDDEWNKYLIEETATLLSDAIIKIRELKLLTVSFLETLPLKTYDYLFFQIHLSVQEILKNYDLIPTDDGNHVCAKYAKLASAEWLRKLLKKEQLIQLFKTENPLSWITGEITDTKNELWRYLKEDLKIEEITPDSFVRKVDESFFREQSDNWFIKFYTQLIGQKALWRRSNYERGPLLSKTFIRLQNDVMVTPFHNNSYPNAYISHGQLIDSNLPLVKSVITQDEESRQFLTDLGIPEFDIVAEVIEHILPNYQYDIINITIDEHLNDIKKIQLAFHTDSHEKKQQLKQKLKTTAFVLLDESNDVNLVLSKPESSYISNNGLRLYFTGYSEVKFINPIYSDDFIIILKELGASDRIRIKKNPQDYMGNIMIRNYYGNHVRGMNGFDQEIQFDGLEHALLYPNIEKSQMIWNEIAIPHLECIRGIIEKSSRQTFEGSERAEVVSAFGQLLRNSEWLPDLSGGFCKPGGLKLDDLPEQFKKNEKLAELLQMKKDEIDKLLDITGINRETFEIAKLLSQNPDLLIVFRQSISESNEKPIFPKRNVISPEYRQNKLEEQIIGASPKKYEERPRSERVSSKVIDPRFWLKEQYTNDSGEMVCQICKEEMPFKKRNGEYYFEAVESLTIEYLPGEHEGQFLALCPLCSAMFKEFVKIDESSTKQLFESLKVIENLEVPLILGIKLTTIQFTEPHALDIKTILNIQ